MIRRTVQIYADSFVTPLPVCVQRGHDDDDYGGGVVHWERETGMVGAVKHGNIDRN